ncbi:MAG: hypothetical protein JWP36_2385 [Paucimonas sp.]|nr:hypothetical protein [Paucimonas sp.]
MDVGSRIDGFVAHVASFREIEVFDIRPLSPSIPGVVFKQADFMSSSSVPQAYCDSLSCLHALEHFGLGRYGDPINPQGYVLGLQNFARILKKGGTLYLSVPVGRERVEFNAHRVFDPVSLVDLAFQNELVLRELAWVAADRSIHRSEDPSHDLQELGKSQYVLGMFTFSKD